MGHANLSNLSEIFVQQLYSKGKLSIKQIADVCIAKGETLHASEGEYEERYMICMGLEDIAEFLLKEDVIEPVDMCPNQEFYFRQWHDGHNDMDEWDCGDDGESGEYAILDSIKFQFISGQRERYPDIPLLGNITH